MGFFEFFKKQVVNSEKQIDIDTKDIYSSFDDLPEVAELESGSEAEDKSNAPALFTAKLLFYEVPVVDLQILKDEVARKYAGCVIDFSDNVLTCRLTDKTGTETTDQSLTCCLAASKDMLKQPLPDEAFKQNWHWKDGAAIAKNCRYELLVVEKKLNIEAGYKVRTETFLDFLTACIKSSNPAVVYSRNGEKLLDPRDVLACHTAVEPDLLHPMTNIRMFKVCDSTTNEIIMDTIGLNTLGLPDFEILFDHQNPAKIAELLLRYCYFIYDIGDNVLHGEYLEGLNPDEKWKCEKRISLLPPLRVVLHVLAQK